MKVVIINGSPRKRGATAYLLHEVERCLKECGAEVAFYHLADLEMRVCTGCGVCYQRGHCVFKDDAEDLSETMRKADGVVIGSSTIASNVSGLLKVFIDRGHFVIEQLLKSKYALSVVTYENYGGKDASRIIQKLLSLSGAKLSASIVERIPFNSDYALHTELKARAQKQALRLYRDMKKKRPHPLQSALWKLAWEVGIKPFVLRKGAQYVGVRRRWSALGLLRETGELS